MPRFGINKKYFWGMGTLNKLPGSTSIPKTKFKRHLRPYWKDDIDAIYGTTKESSQT